MQLWDAAVESALERVVAVKGCFLFLEVPVVEMRDGSVASVCLVFWPSQVFWEPPDSLS